MYTTTSDEFQRLDTISQDACAKVIYATITTRLDYHNGFLLGLPGKTWRRLHARTMLLASSLVPGTVSISHLCYNILIGFWLNIEWCSKCLLYRIQKELHSESAPAYLKKCCNLHKPRTTTLLESHVHLYKSELWSRVPYTPWPRLLCSTWSKPVTSKHWQAGTIDYVRITFHGTPLRSSTAQNISL